MKTDIKTIAKLLATTIWADGVYDEAEEITIAEIAEALELNRDELAAEVDNAIKAISEMDENQVNKYLDEAAADVTKEESEILYECALQLVLCDGVLSRDEVANLLSIGKALGIENEDAMLMLCNMVKEEPEISIEF